MPGSTKNKDGTEGAANRIISEDMLRRFQKHLQEEEKSAPTIQKYMREVRNFAGFLNGGEIQKERVIAYRVLLQKKYQARTVNGKLSAINAYLTFSGNEGCRVRFLKVQHNAFIDADRELEEQEYKQLLSAAKKQKDERLRDHPEGKESEDPAVRGSERQADGIYEMPEYPDWAALLHPDREPNEPLEHLP